eukprot:c14890_g1_i1.p1 GENE.c14890_g1_i1~~c14890_g1_i1.p1  ORF type:complete len:410 (-),score=93.28 c14890_g1_i1:132-1280(-)
MASTQEETAAKRSLDSVDTHNQTSEHLAKKQKIASEKRDVFLSVFEKLNADVLAHFDSLTELDGETKTEIKEYYNMCLQHTVPGGKLTRGLTVVQACQSLVPNLTVEQTFEACILGWCVEWLQAFFLVADDVMDRSTTRRGLPCWYKLPNVCEANAVNDSLVLESCIFIILKKYFSDRPYYGQLVDVVHDVAFKTEVGQHLDTNSTKPDQGLNLSRFTIQRYKSIVKYKTAYYSFHLSCALALIYCDLASKERLTHCETISLLLGEYFQVQDDMLDCYGDPEVIGKIGTDIQDSKCSWLICKALERADASQRAVLEQNYGKHDATSVQAVKDIYKHMQLEQAFENYETKIKSEIDTAIAHTHPAALRAVFEFLLAKIFKRSK